MGTNQNTGINSDAGIHIGKRISQGGIARFLDMIRGCATESTGLKFSCNLILLTNLSVQSIHIERLHMAYDIATYKPFRKE